MILLAIRIRYSNFADLLKLLRREIYHQLAIQHSSNAFIVTINQNKYRQTVED